MTELGPYALALAAAALAWGAFVALIRGWEQPGFRVSCRRAGYAAAALLMLAVAGLAWAAWTSDVRYGFLVPFTHASDSIPHRLASLLARGPRFLLFLTAFAGFGAFAGRVDGPGPSTRRHWALLHVLVLVGLLATWSAASPWRGASEANLMVAPESLEPGAVLAGYLRLVAAALFGVVFLLVWSGPAQIRGEGVALRRPYVWGAWGWLALSGSILSDYAAVEARAPTFLALGQVAWAPAVAWLLGLGFLHAAGLGRRRPQGSLTAITLGVTLFPLALPLLADGGGPWPWIAGAVGAMAFALGAAFRAESGVTPRRWTSAWSRDAVATLAALVLAGAGALALGALFAGGSLPPALWGALAGVGALAAGLSFVFPAVQGSPQRVALRLGPFLLVGFAVAVVASFTSGDLWFGVGCAITAFNLTLAGREILSARPGRAGLWLGGAALAHTGLAILFAGFAAGRLGSQTSAAVQPGGLIVAEVPFVGRVQVRYLGLSLYRSPLSDKWAAAVEVQGPGGDTELLRAEQWLVPGRGELYHVPATSRSVQGSVDVDLAEIISGRAEHVRLQMTVRPLAGAFWLGALLFVLGVLCGMASARTRPEGSP